MLDFNSVLDVLTQVGGARSRQSRMRHALGTKGMGGQGGLGGLLGGVLEAASGGASTGKSSGAGSIAQMAGELLGGNRSAQGRLASAGIETLAQTLMGSGGGGRSKGGTAGGVMALLGGLALTALQNLPEARQAASPSDQIASAPLGLRVPETEAENDTLQQNARTLIISMINAAKCDGQVDREEGDRILSKLRESGVGDEARDFILSEMRKPLDLQGLISQVPDMETAAQVYAASLLAIEVDTPAEKNYLNRLAGGLGLPESAVQRIHEMLNVSYRP